MSDLCHIFYAIINIMQVGLSTLYDIGFNYTIPLNEKGILVVEEDETRVHKKNDKEKIQDSQEKEKTDEEKKSSPSSTDDLTAEERQQLVKLQERDAEVRGHEAAHQAAGGGLTGGASFTYQKGPDGKMYAIGGEVSISTKGASSPQEAITNARQVIAAAMAPSNPSGQDFAVASSARMMELKAQQQLAKQQQEEALGKTTYQNSTDETQKSSQDKEKESVSLDIPA
jgi:hypothetical protein